MVNANLLFWIIKNIPYIELNLFIMNEVVIVVIAIIALIVAVIVYGVLSTTMGYEEDVNQNYIPDRLERMFGADPEKDAEEKKKK